MILISILTARVIFLFPHISDIDIKLRKRKYSYQVFGRSMNTPVHQLSISTGVQTT